MKRQLMSVLAGIALLGGCSSGGEGDGSGNGGTTGAAGMAHGGSGPSGGAGQGPAGTTGTAGHATGTAGTPGTGGTVTSSGEGGTTGVAGGHGGASVSGNGGSIGSGGTTGGGGGGPGGGGPAGSGAGGHAGSGAAGTTGGGGSTGGTQHWVGTWTGAPQLTEDGSNGSSNNLPPAALSGAVLRQVTHVSIGGSQIRVRFSNEFGNGNVVIAKANVAVCKATPLVDSTIDTATNKALSFSGSPGVTIAQGKAVWSDPIDFTLAPLSNLSVTTAFTTVPSSVTGHPGSRTTSYEQTGSTTVDAANMSSAMKADHWYILSGVDVMAGADVQGVVILGDSITDGRGSTTNGNDRWPDDLAKRIMGDSTKANKIAVMNVGIGGNVVQGSGLGPSANDRYMRDVLNQSGVRWVIVFEGTNDIGSEGSSASAITSVFDKFISMAHAQNLLIFGATVTPFGGNSYYSSAHETVRQSVNTYIKSGKFDGAIDFDAAVKDSSNPPKIQSTYDSGDGLHLSPAGYQKLADTVDLSLFK
jgi:lysophospholipase L1-like esterase